MTKTIQNTTDSPKRLLIIYIFATIMGVCGGLIAILLRLSIEYTEYFFKEVLLPILTINVNGINLGYLIVIPLGGLIVGILIEKIASETKGSGIPVILEATALKGGNIRPRVGILKLIVSSITIGSGGSAGKEGPIALIGASIGSLFGKWLKLRPNEKRLLMTCGLAAGIAGSFDAPLGGAIFGLEVLYQGVTFIGSLPVFIAAVVGTAISGRFFGHNPLFDVNIALESVKVAEYPLFIIVGLIFGLISFLWVNFFYSFKKIYEKIKIPNYLKPMIGGFITGAIIMFLPEFGIYGTGFDGIQLALQSNFAILMFLLLGLLKMVATANTIGSGASGGIFGPILYMGCMFGGTIGLILEAIMPQSIGNPTLYCLVGMAALFAGCAQAPLNVSIMIMEFTENFGILPPLLISSAMSYLLAKVLLKNSSIYTFRIIHEGKQLKSDSLFYLESVKVDEMMTDTLVTVDPEMSLDKFAQWSIKYEMNQFPVMKENKYLGVVFIKHLFHTPVSEWEMKRIRDIMVTDYPSIEPFEKVQAAMDIMQEQKLRMILVVDQNIDQITKENPHPLKELKGILTLNDIARAWDQQKK